MDEHRKELFEKYIELKEEIAEKVVKEFNVYGGEKTEELESKYINLIQQYKEIPGPLIEDNIVSEDKYELLRRIESVSEKWKQYFSSITFAISDLVDFYSGAVVSNEISENEKGEEHSYWKFNVRNDLIKEIIPYYFRILDYISFMINECSEQKIISPDKITRDLKRVNFKNMKEKFKEDRTKNILLEAGFSEEDFRKLIEIFFILPFKDMDKNEEGTIERFRNVITHRYYPGIDVSTIYNYPLMIKDRAKLLSSKQLFDEISFRFLALYVHDNLVSLDNFNDLRKLYLSQLSKINREKPDDEEITKIIYEFVDKLDELVPTKSDKNFKDYINNARVSYSSPEFKFTELNKICIKLLRNLGNIMSNIASLDYWRIFLFKSEG
jgi:hypothetical protein